MNKIVLCLLVIGLTSCEKYVTTNDSNPTLKVNGTWRISSVTATYSSSVFKLINVTDNGFYAVSPFQVTNLTDSTIKVTNDTTGIEPVYFYKPGYIWEFDYNNLIIKDNMGNILKTYTFFFDNPNYNYGSFTINGISGNWHIGNLNGLGVAPSSDLQITVPEVVFDVNFNSRKFARAITQDLTVNFVH